MTSLKLDEELDFEDEEYSSRKENKALKAGKNVVKSSSNSIFDQDDIDVKVSGKYNSVTSSENQAEVKKNQGEHIEKSFLKMIKKTENPDLLKDFFISAEAKGQQRIMISKRKESKVENSQPQIKYSIDKGDFIDAKTFEVFKVTKEPKKIKSLSQLFSNQVTRYLKIEGDLLLSLAKDGKNDKIPFKVKSARPLDTLFNIFVERSSKKKIRLVFLNKEKKVAAPPTHKNYEIENRSEFLLILKNALHKIDFEMEVLT